MMSSSSLSDFCEEAHDHVKIRTLQYMLLHLVLDEGSETTLEVKMESLDLCRHLNSRIAY